MLVFGVYPFITSLVGGWANPSEKYAPQIGSFPPVFGVNIPKKNQNHPPDVQLRIMLQAAESGEIFHVASWSDSIPQAGKKFNLP